MAISISCSTHYRVKSVHFFVDHKDEHFHWINAFKYKLLYLGLCLHLYINGEEMQIKDWKGKKAWILLELCISHMWHEENTEQWWHPD